ncbi:hypothetical protein [Amaricoccus tamworthensis]|uniref:hypothetical protein n=1 Tax=Amaricoccus tamworthensis TaxID=57002 RepID=UPI003C7DDEF6
MTTATSLNLDADAPDPSLSPPVQALWWLKKGNLEMGPEWEKAHSICQMGEGSRDHDRVHALSHWIEGDLANANWWYRRTGEERAADIPAEWDRLLADIAG